MITSIAEFISSIRDDCKKWDTKHGPWFSGEPDVETPLLPKLYRKKDDGTNHDENQLIQTFRIKAPSLSSEQVPDRANIDQWLFLAQHVGLPTRLLDWTENALLALWFAIQHKKSVVWMLNPIEMNNLSIKGGATENDKQGFPLTWGISELRKVSLILDL